LAKAIKLLVFSLVKDGKYVVFSLAKAIKLLVFSLAKTLNWHTDIYGDFNGNL